MKVAFLRRTGAISISNKMCLNDDIEDLINRMRDAFKRVNEEEEIMDSIIKKLNDSNSNATGTFVPKRKFVVLEELD